ncbi:protease [Coccidioides immitis H538.4]|uniref:Protease n=1 Tax=Coccidioides immitis H538.4 TaxID=396776 RepID=A0A0J8RET8_COCIT|nr:protease [Coccidioides immitis H538.4]
MAHKSVAQFSETGILNRWAAESVGSQRNPHSSFSHCLTVAETWEIATESSTIGSRAAAKNCITVGASENRRPNIPIKYGSRWNGRIQQSRAYKGGASNPMPLPPELLGPSQCYANVLPYALAWSIQQTSSTG